MESNKLISNRIIYPIRKSRVYKFLAIGAAVFIIGALLILSPPDFLKEADSIFMLLFPGLVLLMIGGFISYSNIKILLGNKNQLLISDEGICDTCTGFSAGQVLWSEVSSIKDSKSANARFIELVLKNPQDFIQKEHNANKKKMLEMSLNGQQPMIMISSMLIECSHEDLLQSLNTAFQNYQKKQHRS